MAHIDSYLEISDSFVRRDGCFVWVRGLTDSDLEHVFDSGVYDIGGKKYVVNCSDMASWSLLEIRVPVYEVVKFGDGPCSDTIKLRRVFSEKSDYIVEAAYAEFKSSAEEDV